MRPGMWRWLVTMLAATMAWLVGYPVHSFLHSFPKYTLGRVHRPSTRDAIILKRQSLGRLDPVPRCG
ncbi:hypothetical protein B0I35DRAFT_424540 [Stachybotrys elegans]|uniref:Uncharacterized protein n=1 Tax=Stachybotrys elegans TaxID=80388 RepID=A0A8K0T1V1_9HYPO|nr:hypothetical protein B0I35DRAFT_424540 [Stachybotrys elegans]